MPRKKAEEKEERKGRQKGLLVTEEWLENFLARECRLEGEELGQVVEKFVRLATALQHVRNGVWMETEVWDGV